MTDPSRAGHQELRSSSSYLQVTPTGRVSVGACCSQVSNQPGDPSLAWGQGGGGGEGLLLRVLKLSEFYGSPSLSSFLIPEELFKYQDVLSLPNLLPKGSSAAHECFSNFCLHSSHLGNLIKLSLCAGHTSKDSAPGERHGALKPGA